MKKREALDFCDCWLPLWTGNQPEKLIEFYSPDALYIDPANKEGLRGHEQILPYFKKLLAKNPNWEWHAVEVFSIETGFVLKWKATIPLGEKLIVEYGLDIVEVQSNQISRNEIYFDRNALLNRKVDTSSAK